MPISISRSVVVILLCTTTNFHLAAVQSEDRFEDTETIVITVSREAVDALTVARNIDKLTSNEIQKIAHNHIQELLVRFPGVNLQRGNGQESLTAIRSPVLTWRGSLWSIANGFRAPQATELYRLQRQQMHQWQNINMLINRS